MKKGDYVLATKYADGDPFDGYAVGWYDGTLAERTDRHLVVGSDGAQYRRNGFRRVERITDELGRWIVQNQIAFEALTHIDPVNLWRFKYGGERERQALERWAKDEGSATVEAYRKTLPARPKIGVEVADQGAALMNALLARKGIAL
jgi:hypothetical protein